MIEHLNEMHKTYRERLVEQKRDKGLESELLEKQISDYEIFIKYLNHYINDIQLRIRRLRSQHEHALKKEQVKKLKEMELLKNES